MERQETYQSCLLRDAERILAFSTRHGWHKAVMTALCHCTHRNLIAICSCHMIIITQIMEKQNALGQNF
jgi:hypothetical protein